MTGLTANERQGGWPGKPEGSRWTNEQWAAIQADGSHLLVAAAAGSGKTAVLVERMITRISDEINPLDVDAMLVATFTKAAAAEMKERIRHALEEALEQRPESKHLRRQIALLPRAAVTTLHSFCLEVVECYAPLIGLDPGFRMANETEAELLRMDTLDEVFEERYAEEGEEGALAALANRFGGERSDEPLHRLVLELHEFAGSHPWPEHWLLTQAGQFADADAETLLRSLWVETLRRDAALLLDGAIHLLKTGLHVAHEPGGPEPYIDTLFADIDGLERASAALTDGDWASWQSAVAGISFGRLKPCKGDAYDPELIEKVKSMRDNAKKTAAKLSEEWLVRSPEQYAAELRSLAPDMSRLAELAIAFGQRYEQAKRAKGLLDFGDLEHYALRILRNTASTPERSEPSLAALNYRERFAEIYLDEYQDTNEVQEAIVALIARRDPGNVFMVGDVKQSIYRFRLAEPGLFLSKYKSYEAYTDENGDGSSMGLPTGSDADGLRIDLARNFRSRREIVNAVNHVFRLIMKEPVGEMDYDGRAELIYGEGYPSEFFEKVAHPSGVIETSSSNPYAVEMIVLDAAAPAKDEQAESEDGATTGEAADENEELEVAQLEARYIADEIRNLISGADGNGQPFAVYDGKAKLYRPAQYRDIVILLRAVSALAPTFIDELKAAGIPAYADLATGYFAATEVDVLLSLLSIIDNPHQDIPLAGVLRSPIGGFGAEDLARVRLVRRGGSFWDALNAAASSESSELAGKASAFVDRLASWRDYARREPLGDLLWMLYRETGYYDFVGGMPGGSQRQANLRALVDRAVQYERSSRFRGLFRFLRFLGRMKDTGADLGAARSLGESENVVRIVSIHRSKGLEFPVVFAAGLGRQFNRQDLNGAFLKHKKLGFGPRVVEEDLRVTYPTLPQLAIRRKLAAEMLAEEMRVLYVALTRPKEKLFLVGTSKDADKQMAQWLGIAEMADGALPAHTVAAATKYFDWLGPAAMLAIDAVDAAVRWSCRVVRSSEYARSAASLDRVAGEVDLERWDAITKGESVEEGNAEAAKQIAATLSWQYDNMSATQVGAKTSVTALKNREAARVFETLTDDSGEERMAAEGASDDGELGQLHTFRLRRPRFMSAKRLTPAERGTAYHLAMQHLPLGSDFLPEHVSGLLDGLVERRIFSTEQRQGIDAASVATFCGSALYERMKASAKVWREVPFTYGMDAAEAYPEAMSPDSGETVIIQGVIDCLFDEEDGLVLVDYKTDELWGRDAKESAEKHRFQVEKYGEAVERIVGKPLKEAYVYFFDGGQAVRLV
ncbi:helicase-exonuclease AddAB subunit AddA [Cohnella soli]|uniref:ATP-dependent helicase/nuclease subunit A n=1 Tax=Cohnella soli TaxID=425005 RepID=A0ABW0I1G9_9BACL